MDLQVLKKLSFSDKEASIYLTLLRIGPSSVRKLAEHAGLNRGTAYDCIKTLQDRGLITFYLKDAKQYFVAEDPEKLRQSLREQEEELQRVDQQLNKYIPELQALYHKGGERPVARYYDKKEIHKILEDILFTCEQSGEKEYSIYSADGLRKHLYESFPTFSDVRIAKGIFVKVIALGDGGELRGFDERKWLKTPSKPSDSTYIIMYPGKTAYISLDGSGEPIGVVIENEGVYATQKAIFESLWHHL